MTLESKNPLSDNIFFVKNMNDELVPAKFLTDENGNPVKNPNTDLNTINSRDNHYFDSLGNECKNKNPDNYLVVPINYSFKDAVNFSNTINYINSIEPGNTATNIVSSYLMISNFVANGDQNLQANYQNADGSMTVHGSYVPMFQDAASFHLGVVSELTGYGALDAQIGGSLYEIPAQITSSLSMSTLANNTMRNNNSITGGAQFVEKNIDQFSEDLTHKENIESSSNINNDVKNFFQNNNVDFSSNSIAFNTSLGDFNFCNSNGETSFSEKSNDGRAISGQITSLFSEVSMTNNGNKNVDVLGTGGVFDFDSSTVTFDPGASATINGNNNSFSLSDLSNLSLSGNQNSVCVAGSAALAKITGDSNNTYVDANASNSTISVNGEKNSIGVNAANVTVTDQGAYNSTALYGSLDKITSNGIADYVSSSGTKDNITLNNYNAQAFSQGADTQVFSNGAYNSISLWGAGNTGNIFGANSSVTAGGPNDFVTMSGYKDDAWMKGNNSDLLSTGDHETSRLDGANDSATATGSQSQISSHGVDDHSYLDGYSDSGAVYGNQSSINTIGFGSSALVLGNFDVAKAYAENSSITTYGVGDWTGLYGNDQTSTVLGNNSGTDSFGTGNTLNFNGMSDSGTIFGAKNTVNEAGFDDSLTMQGNYDIANVKGDDSSVTSYGLGDTSTLYSSHDVATVYGNNSTITSNGLNNILSLDGNNDTGTALGNNNTVNENGFHDSAFMKGNYDIADVTSNHSDSTSSSGSYDFVSNPAYYNVQHNISETDYEQWSASGGKDDYEEDDDDSSDESGFAGSQDIINRTLASGQGPIYQHDVAIGDQVAANSAAAAMRRDAAIAASAPQQAGSSAVKVEGALWGHQTITWSLAKSAGTADAPFSSYMGSVEEQEIKTAFSAWSQASGLTFQEVADSAKSDIRFGWGDFDAKNTGLVGDTSYKTHENQFQSGTIIRLEDPHELMLSKDSAGQAFYTGTDATIEQVLQHEIGHSLGLDCNADPTSVMYYKLTSANRSLDATDVAGIQQIYSNGAINNLVQAMASFDSPAGVLIAQSNTTQPEIAQSLLAVSRT